MAHDEIRDIKARQLYGLVKTCLEAEKCLHWKSEKSSHLKRVFGGEAKLLILDMETNWIYK